VGSPAGIRVEPGPLSSSARIVLVSPPGLGVEPGSDTHITRRRRLARASPQCVLFTRRQPPRARWSPTTQRMKPDRGHTPIDGEAATLAPLDHQPAPAGERTRSTTCTAAQTQNLRGQGRFKKRSNRSERHYGTPELGECSISATWRLLTEPIPRRRPKPLPCPHVPAQHRKKLQESTPSALNPD